MIPVSATPYAFTEQGLAMLSGILNSDKAIDVNIAIMRAFVMIRQYALTYKELTERLKEIEGRFTDVYEAINYLLNKDKLQIEQGQRKRIDLIMSLTFRLVVQCWLDIPRSGIAGTLPDPADPVLTA